MDELLALSAHLPERHFAAGDTVVREGGDDGAIWVFVAGALEVRKGSIAVNAITQPGALVGEVSVLLGRPYGATVVATAPSVLRHAATRRRCSRATPTSPASSPSAWPSG
jgi:CRP/FNR family transcriptional regulator, cyclic AMP receptor protein